MQDISVPQRVSVLPLEERVEVGPQERILTVDQSVAALVRALSLGLDQSDHGI